MRYVPTTHQAIRPLATKQRSTMAAKLLHLPSEIWSSVIWSCVNDLSLVDCLALRLVSSVFDQLVQLYLYDYGILDFHCCPPLSCGWDEIGRPMPRVSPEVAITYWKSFISNRPNRPAWDIVRYDALCRSTDPRTPKDRETQQRLHQGMEELRRSIESVPGKLSASPYIEQTGQLCMNISSSPQRAQSRHQACISVLAEAVVFVFGAQTAWDLLHPLHESSIKSALRVNDLKDMRQNLWLLLGATYIGDLEMFKHYFWRARFVPKEPNRGTKRPYGMIEENSDRAASLFEDRFPRAGQWKQALAACLVVSVRRHHLDLVFWILDQEPSVFLSSFQSLHFEGKNVFETAISEGAAEVVEQFVNHGWHAKSRQPRTRSRYRKALYCVVQLGAEVAGREVIWELLLRNRHEWARHPASVRLMSIAIQKNDLVLAQILVREHANSMLCMPSDEEYLDFNPVPDIFGTSVADPKRAINLSLAAQNRNLDLVQLLLASDETPFSPTKDDRMSCIEGLLSEGTNLDGVELNILEAILSQYQRLDIVAGSVTANRNHETVYLNIFFKYFNLYVKVPFPWERQDRCGDCSPASDTSRNQPDYLTSTSQTERSTPLEDSTIPKASAATRASLESLLPSNYPPAATCSKKDGVGPPGYRQTSEVPTLGEWALATAILDLDVETTQYLVNEMQVSYKAGYVLFQRLSSDKVFASRELELLESFTRKCGISVE